MKPLFICYDRCSTCKKAEKWLIDNNVDFEKRSIISENPSAAELSEWLTLSGLPIRRFFNTSGIKYRELNLKDRVATDSVEELLQLLASDGMVVKRPLLITDTTVLLGFKESEYTTTFQKG
ncbi:MAG: arsenate reductase family protein [Rikenellaceae bacterium]